MPDTHETRLKRARTALEGLSVGDALGGNFEFAPPKIHHAALERRLPDYEWHYTDDTSMALSIYENLRQHQKIDQDSLAKSFAKHFEKRRGYGMGARHLLSRVRQGEDWREVAKDLFKGEGSFGNGGAMRVAPIGAYFADDMSAVIENARLSAAITHSHHEGIAGAIAIAVAAALAFNTRGDMPERQDFIEQVREHVPAGAVRAGLRRAAELPPGTDFEDCLEILGNGSKVSAQDTVPFALWVIGMNMANYEEAIWYTLRAGGDADTLCAIVGGVVVCHTGEAAIPAEWLKQREPLPKWAFEDIEDIEETDAENADDPEPQD